MENHPIPQDVTGFKFRLIGNMTVKQFSYLLAGGIISYILYATSIPGPIKYLFIVCIILGAAALAFVPIDGRPIDKMVFLFIKAIPRENEYVYRKRGARIFFELKEIVPMLKRPLYKKTDVARETQTKKSLLMSRFHSALPLDDTETNFLNKIKPFFEEAVIENREISYKNIGDMKNEQKEKNEDRKTNILRSVLHADKEQKDAQKITQTKIRPEEKEIPEKMVQADTTATNENEELRRRLLEFVHKKSDDKTYKLPDKKLKTVGQAAQNTEQISPQDKGVKAGFPVLPEVPNVVLGIVKDARGKVLPNIIVEVIDKSNNPVRAFKTNALGQFISATQLQNGIYKVSFEDPQKQHEFGTIEINLNGKDIFMPLEIISTDAREKLRRELFEN